MLGCMRMQYVVLRYKSIQFFDGLLSLPIHSFRGTGKIGLKRYTICFTCYHGRARRGDVARALLLASPG